MYKEVTLNSKIIKIRRTIKLHGAQCYHLKLHESMNNLEDREEGDIHFMRNLQT